MNIGIDIRCLMHKNYSGVAEYTYNLLDNIFKLDRKNQYFLFYNSSSNITVNLPQFHYSNVKFRGFKYPNKFFNLSLKLFHYPKIDKLLKDIDLFFIPNINFLALSKTCSSILTIHDLSFEIFPAFFSSKRNLWHRIIDPKSIIGKSEKIIADSQSTKNDLIDLYKLPSKKIKVVYLGVDKQIYKKTETTDPKINSIKNKYKLPAKFILYLGTIEPRKNIESIIQAFELLKKDEQFKNISLVIAGEKGWKDKKIFDLLDKSDFKNQINYIGYINKQDKPYLYNLAELFIFPSYYEGFGLPILEAQACGIPVITSINSSLPEITAASVFLINPDNLTEIKDALNQIIINPDLKKDLIDKGFKNIERFSWQKTAEQTLKYLNI